PARRLSAGPQLRSAPPSRFHLEHTPAQTLHTPAPALLRTLLLSLFFSSFFSSLLSFPFFPSLLALLPPSFLYLFLSLRCSHTLFLHLLHSFYRSFPLSLSL